MTSTAATTELCPGCFANKGLASVCPHCGYDESLKRGPLVLPHRTLLHLGQYLIGKVLGKRGGFGITYLALDTKLETRVAIKEYLPRDLAGRDGDHATVSAHSSEDGEFFRYGLTQFLQEARTLARFDHANIVRVRNFFEENGTGYLVMDYYDGITLADYLAQQPQGKLPEKTAVDILMPILDGLREVHAKNFLHRDIKPQNIYLTTGNRAILLDFGAARQAMGERSRSMSVVLSEGYAPYEQYHRRGEQGPWTDIYACAAVLYHAVAGQAPPPATERMPKDELDTGALKVSASLVNALRLGLETDHHNRPQTMMEFQGLLLGSGGTTEIAAVDSMPMMTDLPSRVKQVPAQPLKSGQNYGRRSVQVRWALALTVIVGIAMTVIGTWDIKKISAGSDVAAPAAVQTTPNFPPPAPTTVVHDDPETILWKETIANGTRERLDDYLKQYPNGKFIELAESALKKLDVRVNAARAKEEIDKKLAAEQFRPEQQAWDLAKADNTPDAYAVYLKTYPTGRFATLALTAQQQVQQQAIEREQQAAAAVAQREQEANHREAERAIQAAQRKAETERRPGRIFKDCNDCPEMVVIPAGKFEMGAADDSSSSPIHSVNIGRAFAIGKTEVTQAQWQMVMRDNPSEHKKCGADCPVDRVTWDGAQTFAKRLSELTGKAYRLPSEAEWEYACRAGGRHKFCGSDNLDSVGWYGCSLFCTTYPVAGKKPNSWGLYDMTGNVHEWVQDCWNVNYTGAPSDGSSWQSGECSKGRVLRGGSWNSNTQEAISTRHSWGTASWGLSNGGFRIVQVLP